MSQHPAPPQTEPQNSSPEQEPPRTNRLEHTLWALHTTAAEIQNTPQGVTLGGLVARLEEASFCFLAILLAVPFFQPFSLGPLTMASGIVFITIGWQMAAGRSIPTLPTKVLACSINGRAWLHAIRFCENLLRWLSRFTRPRITRIIDGPSGSRLTGWLILIGGILLAIPFANLPLNNTFPALMIFFAALAWLERDGLATCVSLFWGAVTLLYFAAAGWLLWKFGSTALNWLQL